jgi:hypothetical protein
MKKNLFFVLCTLYFVFATAFGYSSDDAARANLIAQAGLIVSHEDIGSFRLDDFMLRQELIGTALKLAWIELPSEYQCRGYFSDATFGPESKDAWVCRAFEMGADNGFLTRANNTTRPRDVVTRAEALAIVVQAWNIHLYPENYTMNWLKQQGYADWQTKLLSSLADCRIFNHGVACEDGKDGNIAMGNFRPNAPATRADVFEFMMYTKKMQDEQARICASYFDIFFDGNVETSILTLETLSVQCPNL